jgi:hypothetical protein
VDLYSWVVFGHILAVVFAFMAHGASAFALFRVRAERDRTRLAAILEMSAWSLNTAGILLIVAIVLGIAAAIMGGHFSKLWPWAAIAVIVVVGGSMTPLAGIPMGKVRSALGIGPVKPDEPPLVPASDAELAAAIAAIRPAIPTAIGAAGIVILSWLMRAKPFSPDREVPPSGPSAG